MSTQDWLPFISIRSHRETIAAKDETITLLRETNRQMADALAAFREASQLLTAKAFEVHPTSRRPKAEDETQARKPIDYHTLDPDDNESLVAAAMAEVGGSRTSAVHVLRRVEHIRNQIIQSQKTASAQALTPPEPLPVGIPRSINDAIERAIQDGQAAAAVEVN